MSNLLPRLAALAFHRAPVAEANRAIEEARVLRGADGTPAVSYELALPGLGPEAFLLERALPKLAYFLDCRGVIPPASGGVFASIFSAEGLLFVDAGPVVSLLAETRGLTMAEVRRRYGADGVGDPPLLGS